MSTFCFCNRICNPTLLRSVLPSSRFCLNLSLWPLSVWRDDLQFHRKGHFLSLCTKKFRAIFHWTVNETVTDISVLIVAFYTAYKCTSYDFFLFFFTYFNVDLIILFTVYSSILWTFIVILLRLQRSLKLCQQTSHQNYH